MEITTTGYSIPPEMMEKINADNSNLEHLHLIGNEEKPWEVQHYDFGSRFPEMLNILYFVGYSDISIRLNLDNYFNCSPNHWSYRDNNIWYISPSDVSKVFNKLSDRDDFAHDYRARIQDSIYRPTDRNGEVIPEAACQSIVEKIVEIKTFFKNIADQGNFLLLREV